MPRTGREAAAYQRAAAEYRAAPSEGPIAEMMRLSCEARNQTVRRWAAGWLGDNLGLEVVDQEGGLLNAASSSTGSILQ